jgi:hypothetical protein
VSAPPTAFKYTGQHWADHADECQQANHWEKPAKQDVRDDNSIEGHTRCLEVTMKTLCCLLFTIFLLHKTLYFLFDGAKLQLI